MALVINGVSPTEIKVIKNGTTTDLTVLKYGSQAVWGKPFSLSISQGANTTVSVSRTSSPNQHASTGALSSGATVYYGDVLTISASANSGYNLSTFTVNGTAWNSGNTITVTSAITVVTTAQYVVGWHNRITGTLEFVAGTGKSYNITRADVNGWADSASTRITGYLAVDTADTNFPQQDFTEETITTSTKSVVNYVDSGRVGSIRFTYTMKTDIKLVNGTTNIIGIPTVIITDYSSRFGTTDVPGKLYITKIEQYY